MKSPALVSVDGPASDFAVLFAAARERGVRIGWLDLAATVEPPAALAPAVSAGAAKAVAVGASGSVAVKRRSGEAVLRDLLREHFLGYAIVLVTGIAARPRLAVVEDRFRLDSGAGEARDLDAEAALAELSRPRFRA